MKITFVRHSQTHVDSDIPVSDWNLSDEGVERAKRLARHDAIKSIEIFYSSLQGKALTTVDLLATPNKIPTKTDDRLTEVTSFTNRYIPDVEAYNKSVKDYYERRIARIHDGETIQEALVRFNAAVQSIAEANPEAENIGIVSHGNILTLFSAQFKDLVPCEAHKKILQPDVAIFDWDKKEFLQFFGEIDLQID